MGILFLYSNKAEMNAVLELTRINSDEDATTTSTRIPKGTVNLKKQFEKPNTG